MFRFNRLGFWFIPLLSALLFLPLILAKSLPPISQKASIPNTSTPTTQSLEPSPAWQGPVLPVSQLQVTQKTKEAQAPRASDRHTITQKSLPHQSTATKAGHKLGTDDDAFAPPQFSPSKRSPHSAAQRSSQVTPFSLLQPHPLNLEMRVVVANNSNLAIATSTTGQVVDDTGHVLKTIPSGQAIYTQPAADGIDLNSWHAPPSIWIVPASGGYVYAGEHWYRGRMRLILQSNSLSAINHVNIEDYLYSVVGSEMPSYWSLEALKAQAVAARSYALAQYIRPANAFYHMGATEAWQVYKGIDGESSSTHQAVDTTAGLFLSYKGGLVESLYASTDEVVIQAHDGRGMSQTGAQNLALRGYDYLHILGAYYPGSGLAQLRLATAK